jgi:hypothetical protein
MNEGIKFWIGDDPDLSKMVQEALFAAGHKWASGDANIQHTDSDYLAINDCGDVVMGYARAAYGESPRKEINIDWMRTKKEPVELFGKKYDEKVLKERLADCPTID